ncbi:hypothetical protein OH492_20610 [Vibrio chagasii]|nr:hypothetical protein [Vibrio chagasii]
MKTLTLIQFRGFQSYLWRRFWKLPESTGGADDTMRIEFANSMNGAPVKALAERVQYYDSDGKLVTEPLKDYNPKNHGETVLFR